MNGANGSEALVEESTLESTDAWKCKCGTVNDPEADDLPEDADPDVCKNCGASAFEQTNVELELQVEEDAPSIESVKAGLQEMSGGIATSQDIENAARAEEGLPPLEAAGLLDFGPFNPDNAMKAIFEKSAEVRQLQSLYDRAKDAAKEAKSELDVAAKALVNIIESLKNRRTQALNPSQPYLKDVSGDAPAASVSTSKCPWEREHPGQSCPICTAAQAQDLMPALESEVHPEHEGHAAVAEAARVKNVLEPLADKLRAVNIYTESIELQQLSTDDLNALMAYADEPTPMPPHLVTRCCVAAEPGSIMQVCQNCEEVLHSTNSGTPYPVNALVGFDCDNGKMRDVLVEEIKHSSSETETTRTIKPRGTAKKRAKKDPEGERTRQTDAGRKAATKGSKATKAAAKRGRGRR